MWPILLVFGYCLVIVGASLFGGRLPVMIQLSHGRMQLMLSLIGGLMLAVSLFVLFSHSADELADVHLAVWWTMLGMLAMFFLIRTFHFHQHGPTEIALDEECTHESHSHDCQDVRHAHGLSRRSLGFVGIALGLGLHTLIDGIALAASVQTDISSPQTAGLLGFGTFLAIALHKPLDALSITSVMAASGWSVRAQTLVNACFALMCPLGAALFLFSVDWLITDQQAVVGRALGFSAGAFLCIALGDLLPEVQFHTHDRLKLSVMLLLGVGIGYGVSRLEPAHEHRPHEAHTDAERESH